MPYAAIKHRIVKFHLEALEKRHLDLSASRWNATPMTYMANGRQYVVVSTGGHAWLYPENKQDYVVAYALPEE